MTRKARYRAGVVSASVLVLGISYLPSLGATTRAAKALERRSVLKSCTPSAIVARWDINRIIEQLIVIPVDQNALSQAKTEVAAGVGGMILTGSPPADLKNQLLSALKAAPDGIAPLVMTDEEGGAVQRLWPLIANVPSARTMGATMTPSAIERLARSLALSMHVLGLTMDLAPVADVDARPGPSTMNTDGTRSFSSDTTTVSRDALAFASGLESGGVIPVIKHFPGLGGTIGNTDLVAASTPPWRVVEKSGLIPFERAIAAHIPAVMVSNAVIPGLSRTPASLSRVVVTGELRARLHFHGLILTDSLSSVAVVQAHYSLEGAAVAAVTAGADMVLFNASPSELARTTTAIVSAIRSAVARGAISRDQIEHAAALVLATKHITACVSPIRN
ncbi:MAG TPA: glycoside hydrolase family 3 N-terminal domain-containing protein [Acidimicrobiales bacterium]|nr:glycoside hydrolase family 3 N-terminal domain-containing protein [Acidimicrobiales bacterium]